jgi:hypothetical protein
MYFVSIRKGAFKAMQRSYYCFADQENYLFRGEDFLDILGFDSVEEVKENLEYYEIPFSEIGQDCIVYIGRLKEAGRIKQGNFKGTFYEVII